MFGYCKSTIIQLENIDVHGNKDYMNTEVHYRSRPDTREVEVWHKYKGVVFAGSAIKAEQVYNNLVEEETACYEEIAKYMQNEQGLKSTVSVIKQ